MDVQSGESEEEEVMGEGIGESEMEELLPGWGWRRGKELIPETRWSITKGAISYFKEDDKGGRARVTTDEERLLRGRW